MKTLLKLALVSALGLISFTAHAEDKPADKPAEKATLTGRFVEIKEKVRFVATDKKKYIVVKKVIEEAKAHLNKPVTVDCKVKTKKDKKGNDMHMIVYIKSIKPVAAPAKKEPAKSE